MIGAGCENIARLKIVYGRNPLDAARNLMRHVTRVVVLLERAVDPQLHLQLQRIANLVSSDQVRSDRRKRRARFHLVERIACRHHTPRRPVDKVRVAEYVVHRFCSGHIASRLADHQRKLRFAFEDRGWNVRQHHGLAMSDDAAGCFVKRVDGRGRFARAVFHIVDCHAIDVDRLRQRRTYLDLSDGNARARACGSFKRRTKIAEARDEAVHEITRAGVWNVLYDRRHVNNVVAFEDAQPEIVEVKQLHFILLAR